MKCPSCNLLNSPEVTTCSRCGLSLHGIRSKLNAGRATSENATTSSPEPKKKVIASTTLSTPMSNPALLASMRKRVAEKLASQQRQTPGVHDLPEATPLLSKGSSRSEPTPREQAIIDEIESIMREMRHTAYAVSDVTDLSAHFERLEGVMPANTSEVEIEISQAGENRAHILELFNLLADDISHIGNRRSETVSFLRPDNTAIDAGELSNTVHDLSESIEEEAIHDKSKSFSEDHVTDPDTEAFLPPPSILSILRSKAIDCLVYLVITVAIIWPKQVSLADHQAVSSVLTYYLDIIWLPACVFLLVWFICSMLLILVWGQGIGAYFEQIVICTKDGRATHNDKKILRLLAHLLTLVSGGTRIILWLIQKNGYYCFVSKTRLTYAPFLLSNHFEDGDTPTDTASDNTSTTTS